jgi:hypothetical protein
MRDHVDRVLQFIDGQSRNLREEVGGAIRGHQDSSLRAFHGFEDVLAARIPQLCPILVERRVCTFIQLTVESVLPM